MAHRSVRLNASAVLLTSCLLAACSEGKASGRVRYPVVAGQFYTEDAARLAEQVDHFLKVGKPKATVEGKPVALIAPHAGYSYSGRCAGVAYATVQGQSYKRVVVVAVNHRGGRFTGGSILPVDAYKTPLGDVPLDKGACALLLKSKLFSTHSTAHRAEHSLEVQLPFLQRAIGDFKLVPIVVGNGDVETFEAMAAELRKVTDDGTLVVASCDFTHYGRNFGFAPFTSDVRANIEKLDKGAVDFAVQRDMKGFWGYVQAKRATICGRCPVSVLLAMLPEKATGKLLNYYTSGDATGDYSQSVSYAAIVFTSPGQWGKPYQEIAAGADAEPTESERAEALTDVGVSKEGQKKLLQIARKTLTEVTAGKPAPTLKMADEDLQGKYGVFVTLHKSGQLRGCIGNFRPTTPLYQTVAVQTRMSALEDRRFKPVTASETKDIDIEVSVLLPEKQIADPLAWDLGKHGIIVRRGYRQATFLPQVAEHFKTKEEMLGACCRKAGLPTGVWRDPSTSVLIYGAQVFGEKDLPKGE